MAFISFARWNRNLPYVAGLLGFLFVAFWYYPGFLNGDSMWQLCQARTGVYTDWHPPLLSFLWHWLLYLQDGPGSLFLWHLGLFWVGTALFFDQVIESRRKAAIAIAGFGLYPPIWFTFPILGKDFGTMASGILITGLLMRAQQQRSSAAWWAACAAMLYMLGLRHNSLLAIAPLALWAATLQASPAARLRSFMRGTSRRRRLLAGAALVAGIFSVETFIENSWMRPSPGFSGQTVMVLDLAAVSVAQKHNLLPDFYAGAGRPLTVDQLQAMFYPYDVIPLLWPVPPNPGVGFVRDGKEYTLLAGAWLGMVLTQPGAYLRYRTQLFLGLLGKMPYMWPYWYPLEDELRARFNEPGFNLRAKIKSSEFILATKDWPVYRAWLYVLFLTGVFFLRKKYVPDRFKVPSLAVILSALIYEAGYFVMAPAAQFRYSWWPMAAAILAAAFIRIPDGGFARAEEALFHEKL